MVKAYCSFILVAFFAHFGFGFPGPENQFQAPNASDARGPCPFLNTLANHGFIDRSGKDIPIYELLEQSDDVFGLSAFSLNITAVFFNRLVAGPYRRREDGRLILTLTELFSGIDHDASMARRDKDIVGFEQSQIIDPTLLEEGLFRDRESLSRWDILNYQMARVADSASNNPVFFRAWFIVYFFQIPLEGFISLLAGGGTDTPLMSSVSTTAMRSILVNESLPEGFQRRRDVGAPLLSFLIPNLNLLGIFLYVLISLPMYTWRVFLLPFWPF